jgi:hypothetical protein
MLSLEAALEKCQKEELLKGQIVYEDNIPYSIDEIIDCDDTGISKLLKKYIFNATNVENLQIDINDADDLIALRLMISSESSYIERLDKLMFHLYFELNKSELRGLIIEKYDKYEWTRTFMEKCSYIEKTVMFQTDDEDFDKRFSIHQCVDNDDKLRCNVNSQERIEGNWILQKFGG